MYGSDVNSLSMYVKTGGNLGTPYWTKSGTKGNSWISAQVETGPLSNAQVMIELTLE